MCLEYKPFENIMGNGDTSNFSFSCALFFLCTLFPAQRFLLFLENFVPILSNIKLLSANPFSLEKSEICYLEKS